MTKDAGKTTGSKRKTVIRVETYQVTTLRRQPSMLKAWCVACSAEVEMLTPERAAEWAAVPLATISSWLGAGKLHVAELAPRLLYVCQSSLQQKVRELEVAKNVKNHTQFDRRGRTLAVRRKSIQHQE